MRKIKEEVYRPTTPILYKKTDYSESVILTEKERLDRMHKYYKEKKQKKTKQIEEKVMKVI